MKHLLVFAILSISLLLLSGCAQKPPASVEEPPTIIPVANNTTTLTPALPCTGGNIVQKDDCFAALAVEKNNYAICKSIYSSDKLDSCLAKFADSDLEICKQISGATLRTSCLAKIAEAEKSEAICALIDNSESRAACLKNVLPPCMLIADPDSRALCLALEKSDFTICKTDACFLAYAQNKSDDDACLLMANPTQKQVCLAVVGKSAAICKGASILPIQDSCIEIAAEMLDDSGACDLAESGSSYRNGCYLHFAVERSDMSICQRAEPESGRDACYKNYSIQAADSSACAKIVETLNRQGCYYASATANGMPSLCNPMNTQSQRDDCYSKGVYSTNGPVFEDCPRVTSQIWMDKCYLQYAKNTNNGSVCALIKTSYDKVSCDTLFGVSG